ncbi:SlyX family protein [Natronospira bacteriovora]|uniref:SlyX family protein n=1 Tax=Natronospira bacteriovora TaxID=3069753 RepID=A0ABU0W8K4_9GAMM|nr:SlyX family protein [Natronospira sp. AB-CW4]MDQ2070078.1 SlyX family protein [Natronospira sp. AB-CW4]
MSEDRLNRLEEKLAFQEHSLTEMSDTLYRQQQEIDALKEHQRELAERIRVLQDKGSGASEEEVPPHY